MVAVISLPPTRTVKHDSPYSACDDVPNGLSTSGLQACPPRRHSRSDVPPHTVDVESIRALINDDHVVETFAPNGSDQPLRIRVLPR